MRNTKGNFHLIVDEVELIEKTRKNTLLSFRKNIRWNHSKDKQPQQMREKKQIISFQW